jgi:hypothetical protein
VPAPNRRSPNPANVTHDEHERRSNVIDSAGVICAENARGGPLAKTTGDALQNLHLRFKSGRRLQFFLKISTIQTGRPTGKTPECHLTVTYARRIHYQLNFANMGHVLRSMRED